MENGNTEESLKANTTGKSGGCAFSLERAKFKNGETSLDQLAFSQVTHVRQHKHAMLILFSS
jgi:hypothetical protein